MVGALTRNRAEGFNSRLIERSGRSQQLLGPAPMRRARGASALVPPDRPTGGQVGGQTGALVMNQPPRRSSRSWRQLGVGCCVPTVIRRRRQPSRVGSARTLGGLALVFALIDRSPTLAILAIGMAAAEDGGDHAHEQEPPERSLVGPGEAPVGLGRGRSGDHKGPPHGVRVSLAVEHVEAGVEARDLVAHRLGAQEQLAPKERFRGRMV